jgi:outer membrane protein assembly factor BamB
MQSTPLAVLLAVLSVASSRAANWPSWRGPNANQVSPESKFPLSWSWSEKGPSTNILWRTELPEPGNSSPVVWGDRVFLTQAREDGARRSLMCFDRKSGRLAWEQGVAFAGEDPRHETNPHCAASPVTDGSIVVASFASAGIAAYGFDGKRRWLTDLGPQRHNWGQGSSPVIHGDVVLVYHGPGKDSALYALDKASGVVRWKTAIPEEQPSERFDGFAGKSDGMLGSFSTPLVVRANKGPRPGTDEVVIPASNRLLAFSPADGRRLWWSEGMNPLVYTSASFGEGKVLAMGGYFGSTILVEPGGDGDVTGKRLLWERRAKKHRIGSPILLNGHAYLSTTDGFGQCIHLASGKMMWEERLPSSGADGATWSSMTLAGDRLYVVNRSGDTLVIRASPRFEKLAANPVGELSNSTLAMSDGQLFLRTHKALYGIAEASPASR